MRLMFDDPALEAKLCLLNAAELDELEFGAVGMDVHNVVEIYNAHETQFGGLSRDRVVGLPFFTDVAPCMNNYVVAERFEEGPPLDITLPYVLTFRMKPTPAQIRLLYALGSSRRWVLVARD